MAERLRDRETGEHCAVGAILDTVMADGLNSTGQPVTGHSLTLDRRARRVFAVVRELAKSIPDDFNPTRPGTWPGVDNWCRVVNYNNFQGEQVVMDMFNTTIARLTKIQAQQPVSI